MKFWCMECFGEQLASPSGSYFDTKGEALKHLEDYPSHRVLTKSWWSGWHYGHLKADGSIEIDKE